jgi:hypothetical protein
MSEGEKASERLFDFKQKIEAEEESKMKYSQLVEEEIVELNKNLVELNKILDEEKS